MTPGPEKKDIFGVEGPSHYDLYGQPTYRSGGGKNLETLNRDRTAFPSDGFSARNTGRLRCAPMQRSMVRPESLTVLPACVWSDYERDAMRLGHVSREMEGKWNVVSGGDTVTLLRSWTGHEIHRAHFATVGASEVGGWRIVRAEAERDPDRYPNFGADFDAVMLELVLRTYALAEPATDLRARMVSLVADATGRSNGPAALVQASLLGVRTGPPRAARL